MNRESQSPNPVEDYINKIVGDNDKSPPDKITISPDHPEDSVPPAGKGPIQSPITEKAFQQRKRVLDPTGHLEQIDESEIKVADIRRHTFGLIIIYAQFIVAAVLSTGLIIFLLPSVLGTGTGTRLFMGVLVLLMTIFGVVFLLLVTRIYRGNQLIITDLNVTEVQQISLFNRKVSELSLANVEDVTANIHGIFPTMFNYGELIVETAGEQHNFIFKYCPNPNAHAKALQDARSEYLKKYGGRSH
ncbi:MAG TPA: hypothetical protein VFX86_02240 [Candidatus Saccharimonadales bacterium]|nr:hypothetical protein [Candidatus Saccharimonadales bacterium]